MGRAERWIAGLSAAGLAAAPAAGQTTDAARLINAADRDIFEAVADRQALAVRHKPSGFVCRFAPGSLANAVRVEPKAPRGSYATCATTNANVRTSYALIRLGTGAPSAFYALQLSATEFMTQHRDARPAKGPFGASPLKGGPERRTFRVTHRLGAGQAFTRISVAVVDGWIIRQQVTAPAVETQAADRAAEQAIDTALASMTSRPI